MTVHALFEHYFELFRKLFSPGLHWESLIFPFQTSQQNNVFFLCYACPNTDTPPKMLDMTMSTLSFPSATQSCIKLVHESVNCIRNNRKLVHQIDMTLTNNC